MAASSVSIPFVDIKLTVSVGLFYIDFNFNFVLSMSILWNWSWTKQFYVVFPIERNQCGGMQGRNNFFSLPCNSVADSVVDANAYRNFGPKRFALVLAAFRRPRHRVQDFLPRHRDRSPRYPGVDQIGFGTVDESRAHDFYADDFFHAEPPFSLKKPNEETWKSKRNITSHGPGIILLGKFCSL